MIETGVKNITSVMDCKEDKRMSSLLEKAEIERNLPEKEKAIIFRAYEEEMYGNCTWTASYS